MVDVTVAYKNLEPKQHLAAVRAIMPQTETVQSAADLHAAVLVLNRKIRQVATVDNRALVIFTDVERVSPVVYLHGCGDQVPAWLNGLKQLMRRREGDKDYLIPGLHDLGMIFESTIDGGVQP